MLQIARSERRFRGSAREASNTPTHGGASVREDGKRKNGSTPVTAEPDELLVPSAEGRRVVDRGNPAPVKTLFDAARKRLSDNGGSGTDGGEAADPGPATSRHETAD